MPTRETTLTLTQATATATTRASLPRVLSTLVQRETPRRTRDDFERHETVDRDALLTVFAQTRTKPLVSPRFSPGITFA
jgi:hypothetical protein